MAVGATAAAAYSMVNATDTAAARRPCWPLTSRVVDGGAITGSVGRDADRLGRPGRQTPRCTPRRSPTVAAFAQERAEREAPPAAAAVRDVDQGRVDVRASATGGACCTAGIDIANSIGTPIYAVADGVVIDAGPTAGYGAWVKICGTPTAP